MKTPHQHHRGCSPECEAGSARMILIARTLQRQRLPMDPVTAVALANLGALYANRIGISRDQWTDICGELWDDCEVTRLAEVAERSS